MRIKIAGGTKQQKAVIKEMVPWVANRLFPRQAKSILLEFTITKLKDCSATTIPSCEYVKTPRPHVFDLEIHSKLNMKRFRECIVHELVHVMQYCKGHLYDYEDGTTWYKGELYPSEEVGDTNQETYWTASFEIEARGMEQGLLNLFWKWKRKK